MIMLRVNVEGGEEGETVALLHHGWTHSNPAIYSTTYIYSGVSVYIHVGNIRLQIHMVHVFCQY